MKRGYLGVIVIILLIINKTAFAQKDTTKIKKKYSVRKLPFVISKSKKLNAEDLANKKEGLYFTGVPDISSDPVDGQGIGAEGSIFFNGKKSDPFFEYTAYRAEINLAIFITNKAQKEIRLGFDIPYVFNTKWRLRGETGYEVNPNLLYFGNTEKSLDPLSYYPDNNPSNSIVNNASFDAYDNSLSGKKSFYNTFTKTESVLNIYAERTFLQGRLLLLIGYEIAKIEIRTPHNDSSSVVKDFSSNKIKGFGINSITLLQTGLVYDSRDLETDPTKGVFAEITNELSVNALGSQYNFNKTFLHVNGYYSIFPKVLKRVVLCGSFGLGYIQGEAPFFEYHDVWSSEGDIDVIGGSRTLRGYKQARFTAPVMQYTDFELRWRFWQFKLFKQNLAFSAVPFFDEAGVWNNFKRISHTENLRYSMGLGLRIVWNVNTILRFDYAISKEDKQFFFQLGHTF